MRRAATALTETRAASAHIQSRPAVNELSLVHQLYETENDCNGNATAFRVIQNNLESKFSSLGD